MNITRVDGTVTEEITTRHRQAQVQYVFEDYCAGVWDHNENVDGTMRRRAGRSGRLYTHQVICARLTLAARPRPSYAVVRARLVGGVDCAWARWFEIKRRSRVHFRGVGRLASFEADVIDLGDCFDDFSTSAKRENGVCTKNETNRWHGKSLAA